MMQTNQICEEKKEDALVWLSLVEFYDISMLVGYLKPNAIYSHILNMICPQIVCKKSF